MNKIKAYKLTKDSWSKKESYVKVSCTRSWIIEKFIFARGCRQSPNHIKLIMFLGLLSMNSLEIVMFSHNTYNTQFSLMYLCVYIVILGYLPEKMREQKDHSPLSCSLIIAIKIDLHVPRFKYTKILVNTKFIVHWSKRRKNSITTELLNFKQFNTYEITWGLLSHNLLFSIKLHKFWWVHMNINFCLLD